MKVSKLKGMTVVTSDAFTLGEINDADSDTGTWQITNLDVELTKEAADKLGFHRPWVGSVSVCLPTTAISQVGNVITLNKPLIEFKDLKECKAE